MRENGFRAIGGLAQRLSSDLARSRSKGGQAGGKGVASIVRLRADWPLIVGSDLARVTRPEALLAGRARGARLLRLRVSGAAALEVQHMSGQLVERVNGYLGHHFVEEIRLLQGGLPAAAPRRELRLPPSDPEIAARMAGRVAGVKDPELKAALARLGTRVVAGRRGVLLGAVAGLLTPWSRRLAHAQSSEAKPDEKPAITPLLVPGQPMPPPLTDEQRKLLLVKPTDHVLGKPDAPIVIVDYFSLTCPHCANFHAAVLPAIKSDWIDKGRVRFVYRHWPFDSIATHASQLTECSGPDKFFATIDILFRFQVDWLTAENPDEEMVKILGKQGINAAGCYDKDLLLDKVVDDVQSGQALNVMATPTLFVDGQFAGSPASAEAMSAILRQVAP
jgi:protein-disulfide isomerase